MITERGGLGRRAPTDWKHVERYPLTAATLPSKPTPVVIGVNWYTNFDAPEKDSRGHYWIGRGSLGSKRGGHCVCLKPKGVVDYANWWRFYDQGNEGACVGFGTSRMLTLLNRRAYFARWMWDRAKEIDEWSDTNPGDDNGTSVRAGLSVALGGHIPWTKGLAAVDKDWRLRQKLAPRASEGIAVYRWARSIPDVLEALGYGGLDYVDVLNSWGEGYPHLVRLPASTLEVLWNQDGEVGIVTDL